jgi:hypothetical protein
VIAALGVFMFVILAWSVSREVGRRRRWREADRLSRALFAAAGVRRWR